jgi:hypothetical protein
MNYVTPFGSLGRPTILYLSLHLFPHPAPTPDPLIAPPDRRDTFQFTLS